MPNKSKTGAETESSAQAVQVHVPEPFNSAAEELELATNHLYDYLHQPDEIRGRRRLIENVFAIIEFMGLAVVDPDNEDKRIDADVAIDIIEYRCCRNIKEYNLLRWRALDDGTSKKVLKGQFEEV